jgi:hypothetical protein
MAALERDESACKSPNKYSIMSKILGIMRQTRTENLTPNREIGFPHQDYNMETYQLFIKLIEINFFRDQEFLIEYY